MNTPSAIFRSGVAAAVVVSLAACAELCFDKGPLAFVSTAVIIRPAARIPLQAREELNKVLACFESTLYRIETFKDGKLIATKGELAEPFLCEGLTEEVAKSAQDSNFTGFALQAGFSGSSTHKNPMLLTSSTKPKLEAETMVARLKPVLEHYNKR